VSENDEIVQNAIQVQLKDVGGFSNRKQEIKGLRRKIIMAVFLVVINTIPFIFSLYWFFIDNKTIGDCYAK
jgi:hypothetical protein